MSHGVGVALRRRVTRSKSPRETTPPGRCTNARKIAIPDGDSGFTESSTSTEVPRISIVAGWTCTNPAAAPRLCGVARPNRDSGGRRPGPLSDPAAREVTGPTFITMHVGAQRMQQLVLDHPIHGCVLAPRLRQCRREEVTASDCRRAVGDLMVEHAALKPPVNPDRHHLRATAKTTRPKFRKRVPAVGGTDAAGRQYPGTPPIRANIPALHATIQSRGPLFTQAGGTQRTSCLWSRE